MNLPKFEFGCGKCGSKIYKLRNTKAIGTYYSGTLHYQHFNKKPNIEKIFSILECDNTFCDLCWKDILDIFVAHSIDLPISTRVYGQPKCHDECETCGTIEQIGCRSIKNRDYNSVHKSTMCYECYHIGISFNILPSFTRGKDWWACEDAYWHFRNAFSHITADEYDNEDAFKYFVCIPWIHRDLIRAYVRWFESAKIAVLARSAKNGYKLNGFPLPLQIRHKILLFAIKALIQDTQPGKRFPKDVKPFDYTKVVLNWPRDLILRDDKPHGEYFFKGPFF